MVHSVLLWKQVWNEGNVNALSWTNIYEEKDLREDHITSNFLKVAFHKFHLAHSWILLFNCPSSNLIFLSYFSQSI